jgi:hypothetical protein
MDKELRKEFVRMLEQERGTPIGWAIIMSMVDMLEDEDELERLAETHKGMQEYGQFLSEKEARSIVDGFRNYDGTRGAKWQPNVLFSAVESLGGKRAEMGKYNCWALYAVMNMMSSDYGGVIQTIAQGDSYAKVCYMMAVAFLTDPDRRENVREYFDL